MHEENKSNPFPNLTKALVRKALNRPTPQTSDPQHDLTLGRIALKDFSNARVLDRLLMYERRIENSLHKTILELQRLNLLRNLNSPEPNPEPEAVGATPCGRPFPTSPSELPPCRGSIGAATNRKSRPGGPASRILPISPPSQALSAQNKPNSKYRKINATSDAQKSYREIPPIRLQKNKPNSNPIYHGEAYGEAGTNPIRDTQHACPEGETKPLTPTPIYCTR